MNIEKIEEELKKTIDLYRQNQEEYQDVAISNLLLKLDKLYIQFKVNNDLGITNQKDLDNFKNILNLIENQSETLLKSEECLKEIENLYKLYKKRFKRFQNKYDFVLTLQYVVIPSFILTGIIYMFFK